MIFMDNDIGAIFDGASVATRLLMDEGHIRKNALSEFMNQSDINYKFMDQKMDFQSLWTYVFKVYGHK